MDILVVIIVLLMVLFAASWSSARSYFLKGRLAGMQEATREIIRGIGPHYELAGRQPPEHVTRAVEAIRPRLRKECSSLPRPSLDFWRRGRRRLLAQRL